MNKITCVHCGRILEPGEEYIFHDEAYCTECFDELTTSCDHCGVRIFREDDEGNGHLSLCGRCFSNYYTACDRCGRLVLNEDAHYLDDEEDIPYCHSCYEEHSLIHHYNFKPDPIFMGIAANTSA